MFLLKTRNETNTFAFNEIPCGPQGHEMDEPNGRGITDIPARPPETNAGVRNMTVFLCASYVPNNRRERTNEHTNDSNPSKQKK